MALFHLDHTDANEHSDSALIRRARAGDTEAYALLHERHVDAARALASRMSRSSSDTDDLVAEGFAKVLGVLRRGGGPDEAFRPYLLTAVRRLAYDQSDRERREAPAAIDLDVPAPMTDPVVEGFEHNTAAEAFASLPERWRAVLWHTEVEGQKPAQVALILGIKPNAVAALAYRAREGLREAYLAGHARVAASLPTECREANGRLAGYVRGTVPPGQEARVRAHLEDCGHCQTGYLELANLNTSLGAVVAAAVLGSTGAAYLASGSRSLVAVLAKVWRPGPNGGSGRRVQPAAAAAAVIVVALALAAGGLALRNDGGPSLVADRAAEASPARRTATPSAPAPATPSTADPGTVDPATPELAPVGEPVSTEPPSSVAPAVPVAPAAPAIPVPAVALARPPASASTETTTSLPPPARATSTTTSTTTTVSLPPPLPPADLGVALSTAGPLVDARPGVVVAAVDDAGPSPVGAVTLTIAFAGAQRRGLPDQDGWQCSAPSPSEVTCSGPSLAAGQRMALYLPVVVDGGAATVDLTARVSANGARPDGARSTVDFSAPVASSGMAARFATVDHGAVVAAGNTLMSCPNAAPGCTGARQRMGSNLDNGGWNMTFVDIDDDPATANSSSALVVIPPGAPVLSATLYHGADTTAGSGGSSAGDTSDAGLGTAVIRGPVGAGATVHAERVDRVGTKYQAITDVTDLVAGGGGGAWTVGGIEAGTGAGRYAGWSLVVAYRWSGAPLRSLVVLDGLTQPPSGGSPITLDVGGFVVPASGSSAATISLVTYEGDAGIAGDRFTVDGHDVTDPANPADNLFNSTASDLGAQVGGVDANLFGFDVDRFDLAGLLAAGATSARLEFTTDGDVYLPGAMAFSVDQ